MAPDDWVEKLVINRHYPDQENGHTALYNRYILQEIAACHLPQFLDGNGAFGVPQNAK